jgi:hypothetical protein
LEWLAGYLSEVQLPDDVLVDQELQWLQAGDSHNLACSLGAQAAWHEEDTLQAWVEQQVLDGQRDAEDGPSLEPLSDCRRLELLEEEATEHSILGDNSESYLDVGWRIALAILIRRTDTDVERIGILRNFFSTYQEESRK